MISEISQRYARALHEVAQAKGSADRVFGELRVLADVYDQNKDIQDFLLSPLINPEQKIKALEGALRAKVSDELLSTLKVMAEKNRLSQFAEVSKAFEAISDEAHGVTRGVVRSATPVSADEQKRIEETVTKVTKKKVILTYEVDPTLLGGMVTQVGGWTFDDSLKSHLTKLSDELNRRAN
ncbi:MAG: ATP synthase F1 subunit delta [Bdellovibrionaceae bacterium]|nr:ATP synthase F1 subunit delta [Pseudobdellovibrionaceae bacterium]